MSVMTKEKAEVTMLTPAEVHERTGLSINTLANWRSKGVGPLWTKPVGEVGRTGGTVVYPERDLANWLHNERGMTAEQMKLYLTARQKRRELARARRAQR